MYHTASLFRNTCLALSLLTLSTLMTGWRAVPYRITAVHVDVQPEFPGGQAAMMKYLGDAIVYPAAAITAKVEGTVYLGLTIKADGKVADVKVQRGVHPDIDTEAVRVVNAMPNWKPGSAHGKPVDVQLTLPIAFKLAQE